MMNRDEPSVSPPQIEYGMQGIAAFFGMPPRKAFHLAAGGHLPGVFKMGHQWALDKEVAREGIRSRAEGRGRELQGKTSLDRSQVEEAM